MKPLRRFKDRLKEDLKDPVFKKAFEQEEIFAEVAIQIAKLRQASGLSQKSLAKRLHTTQQTVSRLESMNNRSLSLNTLVKFADILHRRIKIEFI